jgi:ubiquinone/menaquinone biosynthesis C-methylase UbiE
MTVQLINPSTALPLKRIGQDLRDESGVSFPIVDGIPRLAPRDNYAESFGMQWNKFAATQIDRHNAGMTLSRDRFFATTEWDPDELAGLDILEVGSGAGRFSQVILSNTRANLWSVDYSSAVDANLRNNGDIAPDRFRLFQCSVYEMPFADGSFDKAFCLGVLQHTPDFSASVRSIIRKVKIGGEIVVDFYPITGFWTKIHAKYLLRPITKRLPKSALLRLIERTAGPLGAVTRGLRSIGLGALTRFVPVADDRGFPRDLSLGQYREWLILDTFDWFSPEFDQPQRVATVRRMFEQHGAEVTFAGILPGPGAGGAIVRGIRRR